MAEYHDPPLRLTIQGLRWAGDEWSDRFSNEPAAFQIFGTDDGEDEAMVLRGLRRLAVTRLDMWLAKLVMTRESLDFDAPNWPTETDLTRLVVEVETLVEITRALRELAPEIVDDDDDESELAPDPEPSEQSA